MLIGALAQYFFGFTIFVLSTFLVLLVLVQRGRGGGLTGALGGPGGQSAFGTKAGDLVTRITIGVATVWILLCATSVFMLRGRALPQTGGADRPSAKSAMGADTTKGTSGTSESNSALPKLDLPNLDLPKLDLPKSELPDLKPSGPAVTGEPVTQPSAGEAVAPAATSTPATPVVEPSPPAETPQSTPAAPSSSDTPNAPK